MKICKLPTLFGELKNCTDPLRSSRNLHLVSRGREKREGRGEGKGKEVERVTGEAIKGNFVNRDLVNSPVPVYIRRERIGEKKEIGECMKL
jgi:hypothetical protein